MDSFLRYAVQISAGRLVALPASRWKASTAALQLLRLLVQAERGGGALFDQGGVLLRGVVHLGHGLGHLGHATGLLAAGGADLTHDVGDAADGGYHLLHGGAGLVHQLGALLHALHAGGDQALDLLGGIGAALRQRAHLAGHHGKAAALFARAGGLDGGVQRQDVGLESNAVDHANDVGDLAPAVVDAVHGVNDLGHHLAALGRNRGGAQGQLVGLACVIGVLAYGGAQFFHGGGGLLQRAGLAFGACGEVLVALGDLAGGMRDAERGVAHMGHEVAQAALHARQLGHQPDGDAPAARFVMQV